MEQSGNQTRHAAAPLSGQATFCLQTRPSCWTLILWRRVVWRVATNISCEHTAIIFRAQVRGHIPPKRDVLKKMYTIILLYFTLPKLLICEEGETPQKLVTYATMDIFRFYRVLTMVYITHRITGFSGLCPSLVQWLRLVLSKGPNRVGVCPHVRTETDRVSETSCFPSNYLESGRWTRSENQ
jgi:hypothetical protein